MIRIGLSGWTYPGWRGVFYPGDLAHRRELEYASRRFSSIEVNGTHYALQKPETFQRWKKETPADFVFSIKGSRYITHLRRLQNVEEPLANFFAAGVLGLKEKLGPFLWQLPPSLRFQPEKLEAFLALLPRTTTEAGRLIRRAAAGRVTLAGAKPERPLRHCLEVRHESFMTAEFFALLRKFGIAFVFADTAGKWPYAEDLTADFVYIRLHGSRKLYVSGYGRDILRRWAKRIRRWSEGGQPRDARLVTRRNLARREPRDVFVYFDNDAKVKAPANALTLRRLLN
jgi:uncharacterized protein YecE (DUF72 family)